MKSQVSNERNPRSPNKLDKRGGVSTAGIAAVGQKAEKTRRETPSRKAGEESPEFIVGRGDGGESFVPRRNWGKIEENPKKGNAEIKQSPSSRTPQPQSIE